MIKGLMRFLGAGGSSSEKSASKAAVSGAKDTVTSIKDLENFVDYVVRALVDRPDEVRVVAEKENDNDIIKITCNKEDIGKIVGKKGKTIMAIRSLVSGAAGRLQKRVSVEVID